MTPVSRGIATLALILTLGCNVTALPPPPRTLLPTIRPSVPATSGPPPTTLPAEIALPGKPAENTVYDLGKCAGDVPPTSTSGFVLVVFAFTMRSRPLPGVSVKGDTFAAQTDANGRAQVLAPLSTTSVTLTAADRSLPSPITGKAGECRVLAAYFG